MTSKNWRYAADVLLLLPAFAVSAKYTWALFAPMQSDNIEWIADARGLLIAEFVLAHFGGFTGIFLLGERDGKGAMAITALLSTIYLGAVYAVWNLTQSPLLVAEMALLILGRIIASATARAGVPVLLLEGLMRFLLLFTLFMLVLNAGAPGAAFTPEVMAALREEGARVGDKPQQIVLLLAVYFLITGVLDVVAMQVRTARAQRRDADAAIPLMGTSWELRVAQTEMELRFHRDHYAWLLIFAVVGLLATIFGAIVLQKAGANPAFQVGAALLMLSIAVVVGGMVNRRVFVLRASLSGLEWIDTGLFRAGVHLRCDAATAERLVVRSASITLDDGSLAWLEIRGRPANLEIRGLGTASPARLVRELLLSYVRTGNHAAFIEDYRFLAIKAFGEHAPRLLDPPNLRHLGPTQGRGRPNVFLSERA